MSIFVDSITKEGQPEFETLVQFLYAQQPESPGRQSVETIRERVGDEVRRGVVYRCEFNDRVLKRVLGQGK